MLKYLLPLALLAAAGPADAAPVFVEYRIGVLFSGLPGVAIGDTGRLALRYDDAFATPGIAELTPGAGLLDARIAIGPLLIDDSDDIDFPDFPLLTLLNGEIDFFELITDLYEFELFAGSSTLTVTQPGDGGSLFLVATAQQVPEPAAIALFGLSLLTFGTARRFAIKRKP